MKKILGLNKSINKSYLLIEFNERNKYAPVIEIRGWILLDYVCNYFNMEMKNSGNYINYKSEIVEFLNEYLQNVGRDQRYIFLK